MLTAVCMNPSFDRTVTVPSLVPGQVNRILSVRQDVGGKGINVAITARRLGLDTRVIGCAGRRDLMRVCQALEAEQVSHAFLPVDGDVRINTKIVPQDGSAVTELNEPGAPVDAQARQEFLALAEKTLAQDRDVVLTGSLPPLCPPDTYRLLMERMPQCRFVLDVSGEALLAGLQARPFLVKPNRDELQATLHRSLNTIEEVTLAARELLHLGAQHVLVSLGGEGALWVSTSGAWLAPSIPVQVRSTVGAGDAMVGGVMAALDKTEDIREALRFGVAAGTASVMTEGTQLIRREDFDALLPCVRIRDVEACWSEE